MKLLPTPQSYVYSDETLPLTGFSAVRCEVPQDETIAFGLGTLRERYDFGTGETLTLAFSEDEFFAQPNAHEQGYILRRDSDGVTILAHTSVGFLYGMMTLLQLCGDAPADFTVTDRPKIRYRGNMNTLWAESGVWSYDFGDGLEAACRRLRRALDEAAKAKLNLMYADAFGFRSERFPGYNQAMSELAAYARIRGILLMAGGYGMGYGQSAHGDNVFMGRVFRNRRPYPDGELYDCIGTCERDENASTDTLVGRSYGTCLSNDALTDDKISEIREYISNTGVRVLYMHNMDSDEIHEPLWLGRCAECRKRFPSDSLYAADGAAGAFAAFYDRILDTLLPEFPELVICPVSPGYAYAVSTSDAAFEKCRRFWAGVLEYMHNKSGIVPLFRELFYQHDDNRLRFAMLGEKLPSYGCVYFSGGDGFYSDRIYVPSAAYAAAMPGAQLMICANGGALQKPTQYANAEYLWNPDSSAFWNAELTGDYEKLMRDYDALRGGTMRPEGIYDADGLLETSCALLFGKQSAKRIADVFRLRGKNGECPIFTACNVEIWTRRTFVNYPMLWDTPVDAAQQAKFRERFAESALVTYTARDILTQVLENDHFDADTREHLTFLRDSAAVCAKICQLLTRYMDLYIEADTALADHTPVSGDFTVRAEALIHDAQTGLKSVERDGRKPFDPLGGIMIRRGDLFDSVAYCTGQILQSIRTGQRIPPERRPLEVRQWW